MLDLGNTAYLLTQPVSYQVLMFEKRRQNPAADVAIFIDGCIQHNSAIFFVPGRIIRTAPEERNTKWRSTDNHQLFSLLCL